MTAILTWAARNPLAALLAGLLLAALAFGGAQTARLGAAQAAHGKAKTDWSTERLAAAQAALRASEVYREQEARLTAKKDAAEAKHAQAAQERDRARRDLDRTNRELRDTAAAFAAGSAADDSAAACRERAALLAELFSLADAAAGELAQAADRLNDDVRLLLESWPTLAKGIDVERADH